MTLLLDGLLRFPHHQAVLLILVKLPMKL